jgi:type VI secretion system secreted protein Hcp
MALYMQYGTTIKGEVTESAHTGWIAIDSASFGASRSTTVEVGSGQEKRHRDQPTISDLQISRTYDSASPALFNESVVGKPQNVQIDFLEPADGPDAAPNVYLSLFLRNVLISSYSLGGSGGSDPSESLSLNFTAVNIQYTAYDDDDNPTPFKGQFDLASGKSTWWS